jgi:hypothetical protein
MAPKRPLKDAKRFSRNDLEISSDFRGHTEVVAPDSERVVE